MKKKNLHWSIKVKNALVWTTLLSVLLFSCDPQKNSENSKSNSDTSIFTDKVEIQHSIGFDVEYGSNYKLLHLFRHYNEVVDTVTYVLVQNESQAPSEFSDLTEITIPVENVVSMSTTHLGMFKLLEAYGQLKGIENKTYVTNEEIRRLVDNGSVQEVAAAGAINVEQIIDMGTNVLLGVGYPNSQNEAYQQLERTGIPVLLNADWQEKDLLGRTEWIKMLAVLLNKEAKVNKLFSQIEQEYNQVLEMVEAQVEEGPTTITGIAQGDSWYVSGGRSFANYLLEIAKVNYPWADDTSTGSLKLDFETVYEQGLTADFWMAPSNVRTMEGILERDARYADFKSFKNGQIYNIYGRYTEGGGNDYYEMAMMEPHVILKDIVKIFHPDLLPEHDLVYHARLN